jgi:transcriptional regulator with XRE-family HTH domain
MTKWGGCMEVFARRLKWLRETHKFTHKEMAAKLGMSPSGYAKIEYNQRDPKLETLVEISNLFGESVDFLLGISDYTNEMRMIELELSRHHAMKTSFEQQLVHLIMREENASLEGYKEQWSMNIVSTKQLLNKSQKEFNEHLSKLTDKIIWVPMAKPTKNWWLKEAFPIRVGKDRDILENKWIIQLYDKDNNCLGNAIEFKDDFDATLYEEQLKDMFKTQ